MKIPVSIGTRVVTTGGATPGKVGVVVATDSGGFQVRLADGVELMLGRDEFTVFKQHQLQGIVEAGSELERRLRDHIIYRCITGSRAYGLEHEGSDTDRRGCS